MKTIIITIFTLLVGTLSAQVVTETIKVSGNCNMCKERIEGALIIKGVQKANWDVKTQILTVKYNSAKISLEQIEKAINAVGHDTQNFKADDAVYKKLHHCCQYDRFHID